MPQTCGALSRAASGALGISEAESVIAIFRALLPGNAGRALRHCEEWSDEAIHTAVFAQWIASLRSQ
jgi:hypothetical protein